jgi:hypothetical protein
MWACGWPVRAPVGRQSLVAVRRLKSRRSAQIRSYHGVSAWCALEARVLHLSEEADSLFLEYPRKKCVA